MPYRIVQQLRGGGFSEVFEVEDPESALPDRLVLKRLNAEMSQRPAVRAAFADEARLLRELRHPHIVTFRRCYYDEGRQICLLMERVAGEPLDQWARRNAAAPERVLDLFEQLLLAVDYLHHRASPFLHLDLKPDNVLVVAAAEGPHPVLIDFGIARREGGQGLKAYTPPYGAPEQESGGRLSCATDVFALGQILSELLAILAVPPTPAGSGAPQPLAEVAAQATSPAPRQRHADAGAMRLALRRARRGNPASAPAAGPPARFRRMGAWAGAGALALATGATLLPWRPVEDKVAATVQAASPPAEEEAKARFSKLQFSFEEAVLRGRCSLTDADFISARDVASSLPEESEAGQSMRRDLDKLRHACQALERHDTESASVVAELRQKHLLYQNPGERSK